MDLGQAGCEHASGSRGRRGKQPARQAERGGRGTGGNGGVQGGIEDRHGVAPCPRRPFRHRRRGLGSLSTSAHGKSRADPRLDGKVLAGPGVSLWGAAPRLCMGCTARRRRCAADARRSGSVPPRGEPHAHAHESNAPLRREGRGAGQSFGGVPRAMVTVARRAASSASITSG